MRAGSGQERKAVRPGARVSALAPNASLSSRHNYLDAVDARLGTTCSYPANPAFAISLRDAQLWQKDTGSCSPVCEPHRSKRGGRGSARASQPQLLGVR
jgi:hypothetical protein